ncbi:diguanylate cyclase domain-containing protein [Thiorhodovibrio frisius]|uniref:diguanylate cyclase n=1 Tax=Thiorhodovibrio frisius TaxID=631362 RepID=H8Z2M6_9GAMM|nr:diguanylate cyclase [Thiorhodovibrio frisius]EIC22719.1 diguanylate cyclase (GGDEF) domain-containing protein [Thiorhodovibrio frisius]WPL22476.1 Bacteriophytochrome cph2 [Thiorhodovibrio frisius]
MNFATPSARQKCLAHFSGNGAGDDDRPRLLIVDDELIAIRVLHAALEGIGELRFATSGAEALRSVDYDSFDLVLLDVKMPEMDGFEVCQILKRTHPEIPVLFVTAVMGFDSEILALDVGACDFLSKPINPPLIRARVCMHLKLKAQQDRLRMLSDLDPLTDLANRRALGLRLSQEWRRAERQQQPLGLLMADIDHFKAYNDHYGHVCGDTCLRKVAQRLAATVTRAGDMVARYGGEEFAFLLPGSSLADTVALAEKSAAAVRALAIPHAHSDAAPYITLSIGATSFIPNDSKRPMQATESSCLLEAGICEAQPLFEAADQALYAAKTAGRDRVCVWEEAQIDPADHCAYCTGANA